MAVMDTNRGGTPLNGSHSPERPAKLCFVVDDEPAICRMISMALRNFGVETRHFYDVASMIAGLGQERPGLMLLDISLGDSDAIEAIRAMQRASFAGTVYLMSGRAAALIEDVRLVGERHGLRMGPVLAKPFRVDALKRIVDAERWEDDAAKDAETNPTDPAAVTGTGMPPHVNLHEALDRNWVEFWYQPKLDLSSGDLAGAEGLARVRHPEHGMMFPASFIPYADPADLITLAELALRSALRDTAEFAAAGHVIQFAVNVPVEALVKLPIGAIVRECRSNGHGEWGGVVLEVTENQIIRDIEVAHEIATQLRIHGVNIAIDDFGSGYSSLARLKELPFAELKLDRSFVDGCGGDATNASLCRTVVELAHRFGSIAVAEGIETKGDLAMLQSLGCDVAQGFLFAHAMPKEFLLARLMANGQKDFGAAIADGGAESRVCA